MLEKEKKDPTGEERPPTTRESPDKETTTHSTERVELAEAEKSLRVATERATGVTSETKSKVKLMLLPLKSHLLNKLLKKVLNQLERLTKELQLKKPTLPQSRKRKKKKTPRNSPSRNTWLKRRSQL